MNLKTMKWLENLEIEEQIIATANYISHDLRYFRGSGSNKFS